MESQSKKIILGTVQFGLNYGINNPSGQTPLEEAFRILAHAKSSGINILDTAQGYGTAQEVIGKYHQGREQFSVVSKFVAKPLDELKEELDHTLQLLNIPKLYAYLFHRNSDLVSFPECSVFLKEAIAKGLVQHAGISVYTNEEFEMAIEAELIKVIQLPFNLLDNFTRRGELLKRAKSAGKEIHARSVFLQGLFFKPVPFPEKIYPLQPCVDEIGKIANESGMGITELAVRYALSFQEIDYCVLGVETLAQLQINLGSAGPALEQKILDRIHNIAVRDAELLNPGKWK